MGEAPASNMFHKKNDKMFKVLPNLFGIADDNLTVEYDDDGRDNDRT